MEQQSGLFRIVHYIMGVRFSEVSAKRGSTVQQTLILDSLDLYLFNTSENCFSPSRCSLRLQVHFQVDNFLLSGQNVTCTCAFVLQSDWYQQSKAAEVTQLFPRMLPGSVLIPVSLLPPFLGDKAKGTAPLTSENLGGVVTF